MNAGDWNVDGPQQWMMDAMGDEDRNLEFGDRLIQVMDFDLEPRQRMVSARLLVALSADRMASASVAQGMFLEQIAANTLRTAIAQEQIAANTLRTAIAQEQIAKDLHTLVVGISKLLDPEAK